MTTDLAKKAIHGVKSSVIFAVWQRRTGRGLLYSICGRRCWWDRGLLCWLRRKRRRRTFCCSVWEDEDTFARSSCYCCCCMVLRHMMIITWTTTILGTFDFLFRLLWCGGPGAWCISPYCRLNCLHDSRKSDLVPTIVTCKDLSNNVITRKQVYCRKYW